MKTPRRNVLGSLWFIHMLVFLGIGALFGCVMLNQNLLLLCVALSFAGALCGAFIRVLDAIREKKSQD
jgi:hypothetical protein